MSNICILTASNLAISRKEIETRVKNKVSQIGCGVFFTDQNLLHLRKKDQVFVCSFSDGYLLDNCEMLLLPDRCWYNNKTNTVPFLVRMAFLRFVIEDVMDYSKSVELYIGDLGEYMIEEFQTFSVNIQEFIWFMNQHYNNTASSAMHLLLYK